MTDKEKAKELASVLVGEDQNQEPLVEILMEMAQWKEQQMMKYAISGRIDSVSNNSSRLHITAQASNPLTLKTLDRCELIIIKEEGK